MWYVRGIAVLDGKEKYRIEAYAVVSDDDCIADVHGEMPESLKNDAEWAFFQNGLDAADVTVLGRRSHDATPNHASRRRLVMTRSVADVKTDGLIVFWNPAGAELSAALNAFDRPVTHLAVAGGQTIFDYFLTGPYMYSAFHLSRVHGVQLAGGTGVFSHVKPDEVSAEMVLERHGYLPGERCILDEGVDVVSWSLTT